MRTLFRTGWGRNVGIKADLVDISNFDQRQSYPKNISGLAIGLGRSYGDSSLNSSGLSWSSESLKSIEIDKQQMFAACGAGVTMGELERESLKYSLFPKVVPGTEFVTVGGAIASNIHGKSHQRFGSFGEQILELSLLDAEGVAHLLKPQGSTKELFWATIGGMGLTGAIISAKISLMPIETAFVNVAEVRVHSLDELLAKLRDFDRTYQYTVAWIDLSCGFGGRGIVSGANPTNLKDLPEKFLDKPLLVKNPKSFSLPDMFPSRSINRFTVAIFNLIWFYKPLKCRVEHLNSFLHPLDSFNNWNRIYGKKGFLQYQILVPFGKEDFIHILLQELRKIGGVSFLGVLKSFGDIESKYLSFAKAGWTLALDLSASNRKLLQTLDRLDKQLINIGGKVYLTKDSRLSRSNFEKMYPEYQEWLQIKKEIDPINFWQSVQGKRLGLC